jgi:hypothetical protein
MPLRDVGRLTAWKTVEQAPKSRAFRRIQGTRKMLGSTLGKLNGKDKSNREVEEDATDESAPLVERKKAEVSVM